MSDLSVADHLSGIWVKFEVHRWESIEA